MNSTQLPASENRKPVSPPPSATYRWAVVGMLWFICFFNYADRQAIFSIFPLLEKNYHFTKSQLGVIGAAFTWVYAVTSPLAGEVGDRYPRKWIILGGLYIWSLITGLTAQCAKVWQFVLVRGAEGLGETFYFPASMALISDYHAPATRSRAIGLHQTSIYAGIIFGSTLAGWMGQKYGWQSPFWVLALAGMVLGLILQAFIREPRRNEAERQEREDTAVTVTPAALPMNADFARMDAQLAGVARGNNTVSAEPAAIPLGVFLVEFLRTKTAVLLVSAYFGANLVGYVFLTWMPTFLKEKFELNLALAGLGATIFIQSASMVGATLGGFIADRWSRRRVEGRILVQALAALLGTPFIFLCGYTRNPWLLVVALTLFGLCRGIYDSNLTAAYYDVIPSSRRSTATGLMNLIGWIGAGLGALLVGVIVDHHVTMSVAISSTAVIYLVVAAILACTARFTAPKDIRAAQSVRTAAAPLSTLPE